MSKEKSDKSSRRVLTVFTLAMINVAAIVSLRSFPQMANYGLGLIFFYLLAALIFFIPTSLVSAELATGWPQTGGVYIWVREALGNNWGFLAIWLQWIENVIWFPTVLSFAAATIAFPFMPALAKNKFYALAVILVIFWGATIVNFRGMKISGMISSVGVIIGALIPAGLIIILGITWLASGDKSQIIFTAAKLMPDMTNIGNIVFASGVLLGLAGMEMSAVHAQEVKNPQRDYPKAIFLSAIIILTFSILTSLAIAIVVPRGQISLTTGIMEAFVKLLDSFNLGFLIPVMAILITLGVVGQVSTWVIGPSKGLFATAQDGSLPKYFQKFNRNRIPTNMLITQAAITTVISLIFLLMPSVNSSFWILTALTSQLYLIMYILMFVSAIRLRYSKPHAARPYKVPGGNAGMWVIAGIGGLGSFSAIIIGFFPPAQIKTGGIFFYEAFLVFGILIFSAAPLLIHHFRKPDWQPVEKNMKKAA